jgi:SAM-dependent methyltransferase
MMAPRWKHFCSEVSGSIACRSGVLPDALQDADGPNQESRMSTTLHPDLASAYDRYFGSGLYETRYPRPNRAMEAAIRAVLPGVQGEPGTVLDFGCGTGRYLPLLLARPGLSVTGYDISREAIGVCRLRFRQPAESGRLRLVCGDLPVLQEAVAPGSQDLVLMMFGVLGHVSGRAQRVATLRTMHGLLRPGGRLLVTVPSRLRRFRAEQRNCAQRVAEGRLEPGDILYRRQDAGGAVALFYHLFTLPELAGELAEAGFGRPRFSAESVLPERAAIAGLLGRMADAVLRAACPVPLAYGFAALVERA